MRPARCTVAETRRVRQDGIALTGYLTEPTVHHTIGSLMQVGIYSCLYFHNRDTHWDITNGFCRTSNACSAMAIPRRQYESPM